MVILYNILFWGGINIVAVDYTAVSSEVVQNCNTTVTSTDDTSDDDNEAVFNDIEEADSDGADEQAAPEQPSSNTKGRLTYPAPEETVRWVFSDLEKQKKEQEQRERELQNRKALTEKHHKIGDSIPSFGAYVILLCISALILTYRDYRKNRLKG